jgi:hypothetical protein
MELNTGQFITILRHGERGYHALFDVETIRRALGQPLDTQRLVNAAVFSQVKEAVVKLVGIRDLSRQRLFINTLSLPLQNILVRLYFRLLEQYMQNRSYTLH